MTLLLVLSLLLSFCMPPRQICFTSPSSKKKKVAIFWKIDNSIVSTDNLSLPEQTLLNRLWRKETTVLSSRYASRKENEKFFYGNRVIRAMIFQSTVIIFVLRTYRMLRIMLKEKCKRGGVGVSCRSRIYQYFIIIIE